MRRLVRRWGQFALLFALLPSVAAVMAAAGQRGAQGSLGVAVWRTDSGFVVRTAAAAVLASGAVSAVLALGSMLAWGGDEPSQMLRVARVVAAFWLAALIAYPGLGTWIPLYRSLPWWLGTSAVIAALGLAHVRARARVTEVLFTVLAVTLFFTPLPAARRGLAERAGRAFDERDVLVLGFDSVSQEDAKGVLREFTPRAGTKIVYEQAYTPMPLTNAAWRGVLSGRYPRGAEAMPGVKWPSKKEMWLPSQLRGRGYSAVLLQDNAGTNTYDDDEDLEIPTEQGWKALTGGFVWNVAFPISTSSAPWVLDLLGGPADYAGRYGYESEHFWDKALARLAVAARGHPVLFATHSCYSHAPLHLTLREAMRIPGFWRKPPVQLEGGGNAFYGERATGQLVIHEARMQTTRDTIRTVLRRLDQENILGRAWVVVLGDHGPKGPWVGHERTFHVMLGVFAPGQRKDISVQERVSLIDVAPTLRRQLGLSDVGSDGSPLPPFADPLMTREVETRDAPTLESLGIDLAHLTGNDVSRALALHANGTWGTSPEILQRAGQGMSSFTKEESRGSQARPQP